ncbi:MAG: hypothetical protein GKR95_23170 [Gammaproteobacteria bacterium]|nr:hypothetical protein [Gammaproteobacteria bacterium]
MKKPIEDTKPETVLRNQPNYSQNNEMKQMKLVGAKTKLEEQMGNTSPVCPEET